MQSIELVEALLAEVCQLGVTQECHHSYLCTTATPKETSRAAPCVPESAGMDLCLRLDRSCHFLSSDFYSTSSLSPLPPPSFFVLVEVVAIRGFGPNRHHPKGLLHLREGIDLQTSAPRVVVWVQQLPRTGCFAVIVGVLSSVKYQKAFFLFSIKKYSERSEHVLLSTWLDAV